MRQRATALGPLEGFALVFVAVLAAASAALPRDLLLPVHAVVLVVLPALAGAACLSAGRSAHGWTATWRLLGAGCLLYAAGSAVAAALDVLGRPPAPALSWAAAGHLLLPPLAVLALVRLPDVPGRVVPRTRMLLDGVVVTSSLLIVAWLGLFGDLLPDRPGLAAATAALVRPVLDVLVGSVALVALDRLRPSLWSSQALVPIGLAITAFVDALHSVLAAQGGGLTGEPADLVRAVGFLLVWVGAGRHGQRSGDAGRGSSWLLPGVPAALAGGSLVATGRLSEGLGPALTVLGGVLVGGLVLRQQLLAVQNDQLSRSLEDKVAHRTAQLRDAHARSQTRATTDALTGLPNRGGFTEALQLAVGHIDQHGPVGVVLLDLDGFKQVNDGFGHDTGDALLVAVAQRLDEAVPRDAVLARLGGDEFAVMLPDDKFGVAANVLANRLLKVLAEPFPLGGLDLVLGASVGVVLADHPDISVHHLLRDADTAMYSAKEAGRGVSRRFDVSMHAAVRQRLLLEADLRAALAAGELSCHYQAVVDLATDRVIGFEALARWTSPTRGPVPPAEFVPAAERTGLILDLERHLLDVACRQLAEWRRVQPGLTMNVNISPRHLREAGLLGCVMDALGRYGLPPSALVLEVTESLLFDDDDAMHEVLDRLHTTGVGLALDDFGTGYSSLSRLASFPFDKLKVDRSFVVALDDGPSGAAVLNATLAMARGLGMRVVAEGVETPAQLAFLVEHGADSAQGFLLARPEPPAVAARLLGQRLLSRTAARRAPLPAA